MASKQAILDKARGELGSHESPPFSNRVKYSAWYGLVGPWCDMFVSWCAAMSDNGDIVGRFAYTPSHAAWFQSKGRWHTGQDVKVGDIVFFNFIGRISHVGIVEAVRADGIVTLEGNTNGSGSSDGGAVMRHFRSWSSGIVGYSRPAYSDTDSEDWLMDAKAELLKAHQDDRKVIVGLVLAGVKEMLEAERANNGKKHRRTREVVVEKVADVIDDALSGVTGATKVDRAELAAKVEKDVADDDKDDDGVDLEAIVKKLVEAAQADD